jgi:hypothetical protein
MDEWEGKARHYRRTRRPPDKMKLVKTVVSGTRQATAKNARRTSGAARKRRLSTGKKRAG